MVLQQFEDGYGKQRYAAIFNSGSKRKTIFSDAYDQDVQLYKAIQNGTMVRDQAVRYMSDFGLGNLSKTPEEFETAYVSAKKLLDTQKQFASFGSVVGGSLKSIGKNLLNAGVWALVTTVISHSVKAIDSAVRSTENLIDKSEEVKSNWQEMNKSQETANKLAEESSDRFTELSAGVSQTTGANINLSADEYVEYNALREQIASSFPSIVSGYDSEGRAIIDLTGNVKNLTQAYAELEATNRQKQRQDFATTVGEATYQELYGLRAVWGDFNGGSVRTLGNLEALYDTLNRGDENWIKDLIGVRDGGAPSENTPSGFNGSLAEIGYINQMKSAWDYSAATLEEMAASGGWADILQQMYANKGNAQKMAELRNQIIPLIASQMSTLNSGIAQEITTYQQEMQRQMQDAFSRDSFKGVSDEAKVALSSVVSVFDDPAFYKQFDGEGGANKFTTWVEENFITPMSSKGSVSAISGLVAARDDFLNGATTALDFQTISDDLMSGLRMNGVNEDILTKIAEWVFPSDMKLMQDHAKAVFGDTLPNIAKMTYKQLLWTYEHLSESADFSQISTMMAETATKEASEIDSLTESYTAFAEARSKAAEIASTVDSQGFMTAEQYDELDPKYRKAIKREGMTGNTYLDYDEMRKIDKAEAAKELVNAQRGLLNTTADLNDAQERYNALVATGVATDDAKLLRLKAEVDQKQALADKNILLIDSLNSVNNAFSTWSNAMQLGEIGDEFRSTKDALDAINEGLKNGRVNTNKFKASAELLFGEDYRSMGQKGVQKAAAQYGKYLDKDGNVDAAKWYSDFAKAGILTRGKDGSYSANGDFSMSQIMTMLSEAGIQMSEAVVRAGFANLNEGIWNPEDQWKIDGEIVSSMSAAQTATQSNTTALEANTAALLSFNNGEDKAPGEAEGSGNTLMTDGEDVTVNVDADTSSFESEVESAKQSAEKPVEVKTTVEAGKVTGGLDDTTESEAVKPVSLDTDAAMAAATDLQNSLQAPAYKTVTSNIGTLISQARSLNNTLSKPITKVIRQVTIGGVGASQASGTDNASGGTTLVGEIAPEIIVNRKTGTWRLASSPQLTHLNKGDIVFNGNDTKKILSGQKARFGTSMGNGGIKSGKSYASGSKQKSSGSAKKTSTGQSQINAVEALWKRGQTGLTGRDTTGKPSGGGSGGGGGGSSGGGSDDVEEKINELYDWIERALEVAKKATDNLVKVAKQKIGYIAKNIAVDAALVSNSAQIKTNQAGYDRYMQQAAKVQADTGLSADLVNKIQQGAIAIEEYDEDTQKNIESYDKWFKKAEAIKETLEDLKDQERELNLQKLDNINDYYDAKLNRLDARADLSDKRLDYKSTFGQEVTAEDYTDALDATNQKVTQLVAARAAYDAQFKALMASGVIEYDSDDWHKYIGTLEELDQKIVEAEISVGELNDSIAKIKITNLEYALSVLTDAQDAFQSIMDFHDAQGTDNLDEYYVSLIKNGLEQIANLEAQNAELHSQQAGLDVLSEKYQEIQDTLSSNEQSIWDIKTSQESWNDAIADLKIKKLQEQREELEKTNDAYRAQMDLEQALEDLEKAKSQRNQLVFHSGTGYAYEASQEDIRKAQDHVDELRHEQTLRKIDEAIDAIEKAKKTDNIYDYKGANVIKSFDANAVATRLYELVTSSADLEGMVANGVANQASKMVGTSVSAPMTITIGDVNLYGVQDANSLADSIVNQLPNIMLQKLYSKAQ